MTVLCLLAPHHGYCSILYGNEEYTLELNMAADILSAVAGGTVFFFWFNHTRIQPI